MEFFCSLFTFECGPRNWSFIPEVTRQGNDTPIKLAAFKGLNICGIHKPLHLYFPKLFSKNLNLEKDMLLYAMSIPDNDKGRKQYYEQEREVAVSAGAHLRVYPEATKKEKNKPCL